LVSGAIAALNGAQLFVLNATIQGQTIVHNANWNDAWMPATLLADNAWHEAVLDLTPNAPIPFQGTTSVINQIGVQIVPFPAQLPGGPNTPGTMVIDVDTVWLE